MGFFSRKNGKVSLNDDSNNSNGTRSSKSSLRSPPRASNGTSSTFTSPSLPDITLPPAPDPKVDPAAYLRSIYAVRERSKYVFVKAKRNQLAHFTVDLSKFNDTATYLVSIINVSVHDISLEGCSIIRAPLLCTDSPFFQRDFKYNYQAIPPHGRWLHFEAGGRPRVEQLLATWPSSIDNQERTRRLIDLFLVSVLLDAGAGTKWSYKSKESGKMYRRSEGLAIASLEMFKAGYFSSNPDEPCQVDAAGLRTLTMEKLGTGLQVSDANPIIGLEGRAGLITRLGEALDNSGIWGRIGRPGNMLGKSPNRHYLCRHTKNKISGRLPNFPSFHSSFLRTYHYHPDFVELLNERAWKRLARHTNQNQWSISW